MEPNNLDKIVAFDTLYTTNHIQMLKILLPAVSCKFRHKLAVYIKYLELQYTLNVATPCRYGSGLYTREPQEKTDFFSLCDELIPYCTSSEQEKLKALKNMQANIQQFKEMEETLSMMKELFPEGNGMGDYSPDMMSDLFSMFQNKEV